MIEVRETLENNAHTQKSIRGRMQKVFRQMFENICQAIEQVDGERFIEQSWTRDSNGIWISGKNSEDTKYLDRALHNGNVFEKVGVTAIFR